MLKPNSQCDGIKLGAFGRWLGPEVGILMNGISVLKKETPEFSLALSTFWGHSKKIAIYEPESGSSPYSKPAGTLILNFQPPEMCDISFLLCGILL